MFFSPVMSYFIFGSPMTIILNIYLDKLNYPAVSIALDAFGIFCGNNFKSFFCNNSLWCVYSTLKHKFISLRKLMYVMRWPWGHMSPKCNWHIIPVWQQLLWQQIISAMEIQAKQFAILNCIIIHSCLSMYIKCHTLQWQAYKPVTFGMTPLHSDPLKVWTFLFYWHEQVALIGEFCFFFTDTEDAGCYIVNI